MKKFALQAGIKLQLQFLDNPQRGRFQVTVIGYVDGRSLLITAPTVNGHILLLREGQQFVVRFLSGTQIVGFNSEIMKIYNNPFSYVHLKPPDEVEQLNLRNAYRVELDIIASVYKIQRNQESDEVIKPAGNKAIAAKINDMSTTGCQIKLMKPLSENDNALMINAKITVAEQERLLNLEAIKRSHRKMETENQNWHVYGLQFTEMDDDKRLLLNCFVYEKIVKDFYND